MVLQFVFQKTEVWTLNGCTSITKKWRGSVQISQFATSRLVGLSVRYINVDWPVSVTVTLSGSPEHPKEDNQRKK